MNILQIIDERWDSGITNYAINLAKGLSVKGHNVTAACLRFSPAMIQAQSAGLKAVAIGPLEKIAGLRKFAEKNGVRIIHAHTGSGNYIGYISKTPSCRLVRSRGDIRPAKRNMLSDAIIKGTDHTVCAAKFIERDFLSKYPGKSVSVVYQGIHPRKKPAHTRGIDPNRLNIGIAGRLDPVKGHDVFINAARIVIGRFPQARFFVAGREANLKWNRIALKAEHFSIAESVVYKGYVDDIYEFMDNMDIGVVASTGSEAISRAALEWMASAKALVASRTGCLGELIEDNVSGLLYEPGGFNKLAEHIINLAASPRKIAGLGAAARIRAEKHFSFDKFISDTEKIYNGLL